MGSDLYNKLTRYLNKHLETIRGGAENLTDEDLLQYYAKEWDRYTIGANQINRLFTYLNHHWVKREKDDGRKGAYTVYTLALVQWKQNFFNHIQNKLVTAALILLENQRDGEAIDRTLVKEVVDSFVSFCLDETDNENLELLASRMDLLLRDNTEAPNAQE